MHRRLPILLLALLLVAASCASDDGQEAGADATTTEAVSDQPTATDRSDTEPAASSAYADEERWVCRPGMTDNPCERDLDLTVVEADGSVEVVEIDPATDAPLDCFYVYPTINLGDEGNAPFDGDYGPETFVTRSQAAPFAAHCRLFAPVYRQVTLGSFASPDVEELFEVAYADVADAFDHYLAEDNDGRPFVLMGHSQGSGMLSRLITERIDEDDALRDQLVYAMLIGTAVAVPEGEDVGLTFQHVPACRSADEAGCVISYATFRASQPPPPDSFFGMPRDGVGVAICTNPAALEGGPGPLDPHVPATDPVFSPELADPPLITTDRVALPGLLTGECVASGDGFVYLAVESSVTPGDARIDDIGGDLGPEWGLHAVDFGVAMGNLLALVAAQAEALASD